MVIDLTTDSDSDEQLHHHQKHKLSNLFFNLAHRTPSSIPLKRKSDRDSEDASSSISSQPHRNDLTNHHGSHHFHHNSNSHTPRKPFSVLNQDPSTPSPSPETLENRQRGISVVIPSPSQQLKKEILDSGWTRDDYLTGLSERYYPTDAYEKRAHKGAYPPARNKVDRRGVSLDMGHPGTILKEKTRIQQLLYRSFLRKLSNIQGPSVTLAPGDERMLTGFAANFEFVNAYKIRKGVSPVREEFNYGCSCTQGCDLACACLSKDDDSEDTIIQYQRAPDDSRLLVLTPDFLKRTAKIYECNARCNCKGCWNDVVQKGRTVRLEIFHTGNRGFGLRSPDRIRAGQFIDCYLGEVITKKTADVREDLAASQHGHSYLFGLDFHHNDNDIYVVDGQKFGAPTRFINHSCNPNCRIFPVSRNHGDERLYDLAFFALKEIPPMTELSFDYNPSVASRGSEGSNDKNKKIDPNAVKCLCGEKNCRGQLWPNQRKGTK